MSIVSVNTAVEREKFLKRPFELKHGLSDHPLFSLPRLVQLAKSLPRDRIEFNSGKVAVGVKPEDVPKIDMPAEEVIRKIETANAWMVIKFVNEDVAYNELLKTFVEEANGLYDGFTSRATLRLAPTLEIAKSVVRPGGCVFLWKGSRRDEELQAGSWNGDWNLEETRELGNGQVSIVKFIKK